MALFNSHPGSWLGLPDFGITEAVGGLLNRPTTSQGGSNLIGSAPVQNSSASTGSVQGASTSGGFTGPVLPAGYQFPSNNTTSTYSAPQTQTMGAQTSGGDAGSSGPDYSGYYSQLDEMLNSLGGQQQNLTNIANEQTNQQQNTLTDQYTTGTNQLNQYQSKSLKDIGSSIANGFRAGNVLLGSVGAGDSSAANQYAYALAREGSKQRGAVMSDVSNRRQGLKQTYETAKNNLTSQLNAQISSIAQWFSEQQNALRGMKADVAKQQSDQIYQYAINQLQTVQQQALGVQNALNSWVANNATSIQQAQSQMNQNVANNPVLSPMNTTPTSTVASAAPNYFNNANTSDKKQASLFNNYNWLS